MLLNLQEQLMCILMFLLIREILQLQQFEVDVNTASIQNYSITIRGLRLCLLTEESHQW